MPRRFTCLPNACLPIVAVLLIPAAPAAAQHFVVQPAYDRVYDRGWGYDWYDPWREVGRYDDFPNADGIYFDRRPNRRYRVTREPVTVPNPRWRHPYRAYPQARRGLDRRGAPRIDRQRRHFSRGYRETPSTWDGNWVEGSRGGDRRNDRLERDRDRDGDRDRNSNRNRDRDRDERSDRRTDQNDNVNRRNPADRHSRTNRGANATADADRRRSTFADNDDNLLLDTEPTRPVDAAGQDNTNRARRTASSWTGETRSITGEVLRTREVRLPGVDKAMLMAQIATVRESRITVEPASGDGADELDLQTGDYVIVEGRVAERDGQRRFIATRIEWATGDENLWREQRQPAGRDTQRVLGRVTRAWTAAGEGDQPRPMLELAIERTVPVIVNLGSVDRLEDVDIRRGEVASVEGRTVSIHDRPVLVAHRVQTRFGTATPAHADEPRTPRVRRLTGEVIQRRQVAGPGGQPMVLALIEPDEGEQIVANLGAAERVGELDLRSGDRVRIHGHPVMIAHDLRSDGQRVELDHRRVRERAGGGQR